MKRNASKRDERDGRSRHQPKFWSLYRESCDPKRSQKIEGKSSAPLLVAANHACDMIRTRLKQGM